MAIQKLVYKSVASKRENEIRKTVKGQDQYKNKSK